MTQGSCGTCHQPLCFLKVEEGRVVLIVACHDCEQEVHFDLQRLVNGLKPDDLDMMLENFEPTGKPN